MTEERVKVSCYDPKTGDTETQELPPTSYILILGEFCEVTNLQQYSSGTVVITIKPKREKP